MIAVILYPSIVEELFELYQQDLDIEYLNSIATEFIQIQREDVLKNLKILFKKYVI